MIVSVSDADSVVFVSVTPAAAASAAPIVIVGTSFVPVTVMTTVRVVEPLLLSMARTVYVSVRLSPAAR